MSHLLRNWFTLKVFEKRQIDQLFMIMLIILPVGIQPLFNSFEVAPALSIGLYILSILSFLSFLSYKKYPEITIKAISVAFGSLLIFARLTYTNEIGSSPVLSITELFISMMMIFRYGWQKVYWVPLGFILLSILRQVAFDMSWFSHWYVQDPPKLILVIFFALVGFFLQLFSSYYIVKLQKVSKRLMKSSNQLEDLIELQENENIQLERSIAELQDMSSRNSHEIRRPIARMQAVIQMYEDLQQSGLNPEEATGISIKDEFEKNLQEFAKEGTHIMQQNASINQVFELQKSND